MSITRDQKAYWNSRAQDWTSYSEPLIPSQAELIFQQQLLQADSKTLILGVTPELCHVARSRTDRVTSVDFAQNLIDTLRTDTVDYVCRDWISFLEDHTDSYDNIVTDGGLNCLQFPRDWNRISEAIYRSLRPGGMFSPRIYLTTDRPPKNHYKNPNLQRFVASIDRTDKHWMARSDHPDYSDYDVSYAFPPRSTVLQTFSQFTHIDEFIPDYEEGDRFITFVFQR